jgi:hypothetical protein
VAGIGTRTRFPDDLALRVLIRALLKAYEREASYSVAHPSWGLSGLATRGPHTLAEGRALAAALLSSRRATYRAVRSHQRRLLAALMNARNQDNVDLRVRPALLYLVHVLAAAAHAPFHEPRSQRGRDGPPIPRPPLALLTDRRPVGPPSAPAVRPNMNPGEQLAA